MKKINVLYLMTGFAIGGAEKVLLDLIVFLDKEKFNASVVALADMEDTLKDFQDHGITSEKLNMKRSPIDFMRVFLYLNKYVKKHKIDIIHVHLFHSLPFASLLKLFNPKIKVVFTSHNINIGSRLRESIVWALKPFRHADIVFSENMITRMYKKRTAVIANGIDVDNFVGSEEKNKPFTFLSVATIRYEKNQIFLVECAKKLKEKGYNFVIDIVGGGDENQELIDKIQAEIQREGVQDYIRMLGPRSDIPDLLKTAHCLVMPSHNEGLPIVMLEAGAAGLPVISTPVGAIPSLLNNENGYLVVLDDFLETMENVYNNIDVARQKADILKKNIQQNYSIQSMAESHEEIYLSLI